MNLVVIYNTIITNYIKIHESNQSCSTTFYELDKIYFVDLYITKKKTKNENRHLFFANFISFL